MTTPPVAWRCEKQHPTRPEVSHFLTENKAVADDYQRIGWTVTPLVPALADGARPLGVADVMQEQSRPCNEQRPYDLSHGKKGLKG